MKPTVPHHVRLTPLGSRNDDRVHHRLEFGVVGVDQPASVTIASDSFSSPEIVDRISRGGIDLPDHLIDSLAIACFKVIASFIVDYDGECGTWTARDITNWLHKHFTSTDADQIQRAMRLQVTPGLTVDDQVVVGDDDVVLADEYR